MLNYGNISWYIRFPTCIDYHSILANLSWYSMGQYMGCTLWSSWEKMGKSLISLTVFGHVDGWDTPLSDGVLAWNTTELNAGLSSHVKDIWGNLYTQFGSIWGVVHLSKCQIAPMICPASGGEEPKSQWP